MERRSASGHFGFESDPENEQKKRSEKRRADKMPEPEDFIEFGLIPEFVGRLPVVAKLNDLTEDDLVHILTKPRNALIKQREKLFAMEGITLQFEDDAIRAIAREALSRKTGARGLRAIVEELTLDLMYDFGVSKKKGTKKTITITAEDVRKRFIG